MIVALALAGYALLVAVAAPRLLVRGWAQRAPRLAIVVWQAAAASVLLAAVLAGLALTVPSQAVSTNLAGWLRACVRALRVLYSAPGGAVLTGAGLVFAGGVASRAGYCLAREVVGAARLRRRHAALVALLGTPHKQSGAVVVAQDVPMAYCLPGRGGRVVLTTAALSALAPEELDAVLAHERAHLRGRHHLVVAWAVGLARALPWVSLFRTGTVEVARLVEMVADDAATRQHDRLTVARALVLLSGQTAPAAAMGAAGPTALLRVRRLAAPVDPLGWWRAALGLAAAGVALVLPVAIAVLPAVEAGRMTICPLVGV